MRQTISLAARNPDGKRSAAGNANYLLKQMNQRTLLQLLRRHKSMSRADLARQSGLNPSTISSLTAELIEAGLVREHGRAMLSSAGRRPELLELVAEARYALGVYIGDIYCLGSIIDLSGQIRASFRIQTPTNDDPATVLETVISEARAMLAQWDGPHNRLIGVGLGLTGLVDSEQGMALFSPNLGWKNVEVRERWQRAFQLPVFVDNDVRALALGEQWFGLGQAAQSLACIHIGAGIGCGVVMDGEIYRGATGGGGEIGHTVVDVNGPLCRCGNNGCLETLGGGQAVLARVAQGLLAGVPSRLGDVTDNDARRLSLPLIFDAARNGDRLARGAIEQTITYVGITIANVINTFNPEMVILSGELIEEGTDLIVDPAITHARRHIFGAAAKNTSIHTTHLEKHASTLGTACLALQHWFAAYTA